MAKSDQDDRYSSFQAAGLPATLFASIVVIIYIVVRFQLEAACIISSTCCRSCSSQILLVLLEALLNRHRLHTCNFHRVQLLLLSGRVDNV